MTQQGLYGRMAAAVAVVGLWGLGLGVPLGGLGLVALGAGPAAAETSGAVVRPRARPALPEAEGAALSGVAETSAAEATPKARPEDLASAVPLTRPESLPGAQGGPQARQSAAEPLRDPNRGAVTNLPLPRFVSLKTGEGNARRGPGLTHRIDWVFTRAGMPLQITAEYENWRRVEDVDGLGGWVHYSLLSGVRSVIVRGEMVEFRNMPRPEGTVLFKAEAGVVGRVQSCDGTWCRVQVDGERGWAPITALWGVEPGETLD